MSRAETLRPDMPNESEHHETGLIDEVEAAEGQESLTRSGENYYACPTCGQAVDRRHLDEVLHHCREGHRPLVFH